MIKDPRITLFDLAMCLSDAMDLISPALVNHHKEVAFLAAHIGGQMGLPDEDQADLVMAGALHDIGALSLKERVNSLDFEIKEPVLHSTKGAALLGSFKPLSHLAPIVRWHHRAWDKGRGASVRGAAVPLASHILHCADRIAVSMKKSQPILEQTSGIVARIRARAPSRFHPRVVEAFCDLAGKEYFWLDAMSSTVYRVLRQKVRPRSLYLDLDHLNDLALFFSRIIDFRSAFTAAHSCGVAASAEALAKCAGFCRRECDLMRIAGFLHDLGKLAVPSEILEKPGSLTAHEFAIVRSHTYHTFRILDTLEDFDTINSWGAFHHERLNGKGYPFHHTGDTLSVGSRIMCVADVFTALSENRPYRAGMPLPEALSIVNGMAQRASLDPAVVSMLVANLSDVNAARLSAQRASSVAYASILPARDRAPEK